MANSPYRRSSRDQSIRYQRRISRSPSQDRKYGGETRKKVQRNREYQSHNYEREKPRYDERYERKNESKYEKKQTIEVKFSKPPSQIKVHFRFKPIKINPKNQDDLMQSIKNHIASNIGPVEYFERSYDSQPGYLIIQLGFKYDHDAMLYYGGKKGQFEVKINKQLLNIQAEPTKAFGLLVPELQSKKKKSKKNQKSKSIQRRSKSIDRKQRSKEKQKHRRSRRSSSGSQSGSSSSSSRSHSGRSRRQRNGRKQHSHKQSRYDKPSNFHHQRKQIRPQQRNYRKQHQNGHHHSQGYSNTNLKKVQENKKFTKTLYFFGIHYSVNSKDMMKLLYNHKQGPFYSHEFNWRKMNGSISEYLQAKFQEKQAQKLLEIGDKMQVKGHPFIIIQSQSNSNEHLLQKLAQYQVNIEFPLFLQPYYLLKGLIQCGRLIQIVSNNRLNQQGKSDFFNVTFNSKEVCRKLKDVKKTKSGIIVQGVNEEDVIMVFRPNNQTQLMSSNYVQQEEEQKRQEKARSSPSPRNYQNEKNQY